MARGDFVLFDEFLVNLGESDHDFSSDVLKLGFIDNTVVPHLSDATPTWSDYSANEVATTGGYTPDGEIVTNVSYVEVDGVATLDGDNVSLAQNDTGFEDAYWAILYNSTQVDGAAIGYVDLGGPLSEQVGPLSVNWSTSGIVIIDKVG